MSFMYRFVLLDDDGNEFMGTDVDEPKPQIDAEFWSEFMKGGCTMQFIKKYKETEE
jgi:hypothetical protein